MLEVEEGKQNRVRLGEGGGRLELRSWRGACRGEWPEMVPPQEQQQHKVPSPSRINLHALKARIVKRVGPERANQYFSHFRSFISSRLRKKELDKLVVLTIGKQNVALHNQLVRAVLHNAIRAQLPPPPPPPPSKDVLKPVKGIRRKPLSPSIPNDDGFPQNSTPLPPPSWSNGDSFASTPRKGRSCIRDRKANNDRSSPLAPRELSSTAVLDDIALKTGPNEYLKSPDLSRPLQEIDGAAQQLVDGERNTGLAPPVKRLRVLSHIKSTSVQSGKGVESGQLDFDKSVQLKEREEICPPAGNFIRAPLGIPFCSGSVGAARRPPFRSFPGSLVHLLLVDNTEEELLDVGDLPDAETTHRRMEHIATEEGLEGVSRDCADILNHALDALLNRLIKACVDIVGSKRVSDQERDVIPKNSGIEGVLSGIKLHQGMNGVWPGPTAEISNKDREKVRSPISLADFKVAMDLNPQQLGEDWPVQLEKLSFRIFDQ